MKAVYVHPKYSTAGNNEASKLSISGASLPTIVKQGSYFDCKGTVSSNYTITNITAKILKPDGTTVMYEKYVTPNTNSYSLYGSVLDTSLKFNLLSPGTYYYKIWATDSKVKGKNLVSQKFTVIEKNGHIVVVDNAVEPTCVSSGKTQGSHCSGCGLVLVAQQTVSATGHNVIVDSAVSADCNNEGITEGSHCSTCGEVIVAQKTIPKTSHSYVCTITPATFDENGFMLEKCKCCGKISDSSEINHIGYIKLSETKFTYNGMVQKPSVIVKDSYNNVISSENYTVTYSKGCKNAKTYRVRIIFKGNYSGTVTKKFEIKKAASNMTVTPGTKTLRYSSLRKKSRKVGLNVEDNSGEITYKTSSKKLIVKDDMLIIKKGIKKGKYAIYVKDKGDKNHSSKTKKIKITIR